MKNSTFLFIALLLSTLSFNAQQLISFEAGEGFTLGEINGQNGWMSNPNYTTFVNVVDTQSTDGTNSLYFSADPNGPIPNNSITGTGINGFNFGDITFTADIFVESGANPSEFNIILQSLTQNALTSRVVFFDGTIILVDSVPNPQFVTAGNFTPDVWFELKIIHDFTAGTIEYFIDDTLFYTGNVVNGTGIEEMLLFSSFNQTGFYIDNINFTPNNLNTDQFESVEIDIFPNPATDKLSLRSNNVPFNSARIFDFAGREYAVSLNIDNSINVNDLSSGMYILKVETDLGTKNLKFIKR